MKSARLPSPQNELLDLTFERARPASRSRARISLRFSSLRRSNCEYNGIDAPLAWATLGCERPNGGTGHFATARLDWCPGQDEKSRVDCR